MVVSSRVVSKTLKLIKDHLKHRQVFMFVKLEIHLNNKTIKDINEQTYYS